MEVLLRNPSLGYLGNFLWVPKGSIDLEGMKKALSLRFVDNYSEEKIRYVYLWRESEHHLLVPRCLWKPANMTFPVIDCRPVDYPETGVTSRIKLDHRMVNGELRPTGENVQQKAFSALLQAESGILQLGCGKGKGQPLWETVYTQEGPTTIGSVKVGDYILGSDGRKTRVEGVFPQGAVQTYWVHFSDGTKVCCDGNHLWSVWVKNKHPEVISTNDLIAKGLSDAAGLKYAVPYCKPAVFHKKKDVVLDPWLLGAWLGDGSATGNPKFHNPEKDLQERFINELPLDTGYAQAFEDRCDEVRVVGGVMNMWLERYGLKGTTAETKFIPECYLYSDPRTRMELLRGLLDTDGSIANQNRTVEYSTVSMKLADQVVELVQSLGGRASKVVRTTNYTYKGKKKPGRPSARIRITFPGGSDMGAPVSSKKHLALWDSAPGQRGRKYIKEIVPAAVEETVCLKVAARDELYLTSNYTVTHNTVIALHLAATLNRPTLIVLDNTNLLAQWKEDIEQFLDVPGGVGLIQGDKFDWQKGVVLATYHTLGAIARDLPEEVKRWFGLIIFDEGHHISAATFAPAAEVFYGYRLALTATPVRDDGLHIIYDNHIGPIIYKDVTHVTKPRIVFKWTGLQLDPTADARSRNGEVHLSKVSTHFGQWHRRMSMILDDTERALSYGRKVLVLCNSIDETVNLCSLWTQRSWRQGPTGNLYTDIPVPSMLEVGGDVPPVALDPEQRTFAESEIARIDNLIAKGHPLGLQHSRQRAEFELQLRQDEVHRRVTSELSRRQKVYRQWLTGNLTDAGLMIHKVSPEDRMEYIRTKRVVFGIIKYGKEGLDDEYLDTVLVSTPFSSRNGLQQLMGRPTRQKPGKKSPLVVFYEDDIGPLIGMCKKLRGHLTAWPLEENGPFDYEMHDHPRAVGHGYRPIFEDIREAA